MRDKAGVDAQVLKCGATPSAVEPEERGAGRRAMQHQPPAWMALGRLSSLAVAVAVAAAATGAYPSGTRQVRAPAAQNEAPVVRNRATVTLPPTPDR